ncbi:MAG: SDR family NAD(P)-dependent oxidoreductase [Verrucomicrobia bacterium]|nr:SDR family NAD(P)-dependent oxidoreductase [Verrucomicrobiota bacterium]
MSDSLQEKSIVIIGGTTGLGLSAAQAFVNAGARVVLVGRSADSTDAALKLIGSEARALVADATLPTTAVTAIDLSLQHFGGFDGLYHVAGGSGRRRGDGPLAEITNEGWAFTLDLNLNSLFYSNRAAIQQFLKQSSGGTILNMGSVLSFSPSPEFFTTHAYAASKAAIVGLTQSAASYYASKNIRLNVIAPALVETPMSVRAQQNPAIMEFIKTKQPLDGRRIGIPSDLDAAAVFFMSDASKFVTGQVLAVDGGWCLSGG